LYLEVDRGGGSTSVGFVDEFSAAAICSFYEIKLRMLSYLLRLWACWPARPIPRHWLKVRKFYMTPKANPEYRLYASQLLSRGLNIEPLTLRCHLADGRTRLRVDADRYSFIVSDLHRLLLAGLSGALRNIPYVIQLYGPPTWGVDL
jgi:hypothetical protein